MAQPTGEADSMKDALQVLLDIEAIRALVAQYAQHVAQGQGAQVSELFTEDGRYGTRQGPRGETNVATRAAIKANLSHLTVGTAIPLVTNVIVKLDGDRATGSSTLFSPRSAPARGSSAMQPFYGVYADKYSRVDGRWYFVERIFTYFPPPAE